MITQTELKTLVPSLVMSGVLLYEAITGNAVSEHVQGELVNGILIGAGYMVTLWGIWRNHQKNKPPEVTTPSEKQDVHIIEETQQNVSRGTSPIVTQEDLNKKIGG